MWARGISIDDLSSAIKSGHQLHRRGPIGQQLRHRDPAAAGPTRNRRAIQQPDRRRHAATRRSICATSPTVKDSVQDERMNMRFWVRGYDVPSATVIVAVNRRAGANAVEVAKCIRRNPAAWSARNCRARSASRPSTIARSASCNSVTDVRDDSGHRVRPRRDRDLRLSWAARPTR